jgi:hypothetical protein
MRKTTVIPGGVLPPPSVTRLSGACLTRGFAAPSRDGCALIGRGLLWTSSYAQEVPSGDRLGSGPQGPETMDLEGARRGRGDLNRAPVSLDTVWTPMTGRVSPVGAEHPLREPPWREPSRGLAQTAVETTVVLDGEATGLSTGPTNRQPGTARPGSRASVRAMFTSRNLGLRDCPRYDATMRSAVGNSSRPARHSLARLGRVRLQ